jgi:riboflavin kinase/FMN adenylyltransferase
MRILDGGAPALPKDVRRTIVTVGTFDGVHRGHLDVLARLAARAKETGLPSLLVTFASHPLEIVRPDAAPPLLSTREEKLAVLAGTALDYVVMLPFTRELSKLSADDFVDRILLEQFRMVELLVGHDHGFGRGREGDVETLRSLGALRGFRVDVVPPVETDDGEPVSSSSIRRALLAGHLDAARAALGRPYALRGVVVRGDGRGRTIGFPTVNVQASSPRKLLPPDGVYAVVVDTPRGRFGGMLNLGGRPTFGELGRTIEAHLFDVNADFYGDEMEIGFIARLRDTMRFAGPDALRTQLAADERAARLALTDPVEAGNLTGSMQVPPSTP